jgi:TRAP-type mannitol/chloroaromatic compound transport system permease small subunit
MAEPEAGGSNSGKTNKAPSQDGAFDSGLGQVLSGLNSVGSVWIFVLMVLINADAFGRTLFNAPINGVPEMIELSIVGIVFLQMGDALRNGRLTRSDGFFNLALTRLPTLGRAMGATFDLLGAVFVGLILYGSVPLLAESWTRDYYVGVEGWFTVPVWPVKVIIVIGCVVTLAQFLAFAWRYLVPSPPDRPSGAASHFE